MNQKRATKNIIIGLVFIIVLIGVVSGCGRSSTTNNKNMVTNTKESRINLYTSELQSVVGKSGYSVIFTSGAKFVQFAVDGKFLLDIPSQQLSDDQKGQLVSLLGSKATQETASVGATFLTASEAAEITERVFLEVYSLSENYEVTSEIIK